MNLDVQKNTGIESLITIVPYGVDALHSIEAYSELIMKVQLDKECDIEWELVVTNELRESYEEAGFQANAVFVHGKCIEALSLHRSYLEGSVINVDFASIYPSVEIRYAEDQSMYEAVIQEIVSLTVKKALAYYGEATGIKVRLNGSDYDTWVCSSLVKKAVNSLSPSFTGSITVVKNEPIVIENKLSVTPRLFSVTLKRLTDVLLSLGGYYFVASSDFKVFFSDDYEMHLKIMLDDFKDDKASYKIELSSPGIGVQVVQDDFNSSVDSIKKHIEEILAKQFILLYGNSC